MILKDLQGNSYKLQLTGIYNQTNNSVKSSLHLKARELLQSIYSGVPILEEVPIQIRPKEMYYLDFFLPLLNLGIEIQGEQHYNKNAMFHKSQSDFLKQQKRDAEKRLWAEINGFDLIELKFDEQDKWQEQLLK